MNYWIDENSETNNVIVLNDSTIFIGSCDKEAYNKVSQQLADQDSPIEVLGTDDLTTIPLNQIQSITSRSTDKDVDINYKAKKDIENSTIYFDSLEKKQNFISDIDHYMPENLVKSEYKQSVVTAAISPIISLILSLSFTYLFFDKFRWPAIIIGGIWILASIYILLSRVKKPPTVTRWTIGARYFRKIWHGIKIGFSYAIVALIIIAVYGKLPDSYGPKSIYQQIKDESLSSSEIEKLLSRGANINHKASDGNTALSIAIEWNEDDLAIALIESGASLSIMNGDGETPLKQAMSNDSSIGVIESMLKNGASLEFKIEGVSPIEHSKQLGNTELEELISRYSSRL